ncbi:MAG TPA: hypothetical protein VGK67_33320 [Myxococcales bacterium]|jgi:hypothetical protein
MPASADDLILAMQHLQAQARESLEARAQQAGLGRLKSSAQKLAWQAHKEVAECEAILEGGDRRLEELKVGGVTSEEAPEFVAVADKMADAKKRLVKARAQLNFALDRMQEAERREYEAFHAEVRAETHGALAQDLGPAKGT